MASQTDAKETKPLTSTNDDELDKSVEDGELHGDGLDTDDVGEEDVPDDFFDDFANDDFMDGLDIVDAWDETEKKKNEGAAKKETTKKSRCNPGKRERAKRREERRQRSRERHKNELPSKQSESDLSELRRDPSKTRRDMERDRENYVKKKEQKLISKVIETGLVPPGMETEVDLNNIDKETKPEKQTPSKVQEHNRDREIRKEKSRERRKRRSRSFEKMGSYRGWSRGRSGDRRRERSIGRRNRSRERRRSRSREMRETRNWEENMGRIAGNYPPTHIRRRSRSISDRERWLRRSDSPEKKYMTRPHEEKMSFLEELKMKLDGHPSPIIPHNAMAPVEYPFIQNSSQAYIPPPTNIYPPVQVPSHPPNDYFNPNSNPQYDQNFFIGEPQAPTPMNNYPMNGPPGPVLPPSDYTGMGGLHEPTQPLGVAPVPPPSAQPVRQVDNVSKLMEQIRAVTNSKVNKSGTAAQLLQEKKLSLTDFLSMNSRPAAFSSNPEALQKKVNVLSRCQDVVKELTGDKKFGGKLTVVKTRKQWSESRYNNVSPLLRKNPVKLTYSTPVKDNEKNYYNKMIDRALAKTKIIKEVIDLDDYGDDEPIVTLPPPPPPTGIQKKSSFNVILKTPDLTKRVLMKMCQTDPFDCQDCEKRRSKNFRSIGIQCGESERYNVGVQVIESDIIMSKIPKNQSLASLTPAQLLGRSESITARADNFGNPYGRPAVTNFYDAFEYSEFRERDSRRFEYQSPAFPSPVADARKFPRF